MKCVDAFHTMEKLRQVLWFSVGDCPFEFGSVESFFFLLTFFFVSSWLWLVTTFFIISGWSFDNSNWLYLLEFLVLGSALIL